MGAPTHMPRANAGHCHRCIHDGCDDLLTTPVDPPNVVWRAAPLICNRVFTTSKGVVAAAAVAPATAPATRLLHNTSTLLLALVLALARMAGSDRLLLLLL